jgi:hypothetical protein
VRTEEEKYEAGVQTERRFFSALQARVQGTPPWLIRVKAATYEQDQGGIDALAYVQIPGLRRRAVIPIQIKSSSQGMLKYFRKRPKYWNAGIVVIIAHGYDANEIRQMTYDGLAVIRRNWKRYEDSIRWILAPAHVRVLMPESERERRRRARKEKRTNERLRQQELEWKGSKVPKQ